MSLPPLPAGDPDDARAVPGASGPAGASTPVGATPTADSGTGGSAAGPRSASDHGPAGAPPSVPRRGAPGYANTGAASGRSAAPYGNGDPANAPRTSAPGYPPAASLSPYGNRPAPYSGTPSAGQNTPRGARPASSYPANTYPASSYPTPGAGPTHAGSLSAAAAPSASSRTERRRRARARGWIAALAILLPIGIAGGGVAGYWIATTGNTYDTRAVEQRVAEVIRTDYGLSDLDSVTCPDAIKVQQGESFQCTFDYAGGRQTITVTQGSQSGQLIVGSPGS